MAITTNVLSGASKGTSWVGARAFSEILKEYYLPATRDLLNSKRILSRFLRRNQEDVAGREVVISANIGRNEGIGYIAEGGKLPDPGSQGYDQIRYETRNSYGRILVTGQASSSSRNNRGAFLRHLDAEIRGLARDIQHEDNRIMFGNGSGRLTRVVSAAGPPTYNVADPGGIVSPGTGTQYLRPGMRVAYVTAETDDVLSATLDTFGGAASQVATITAVDHVAGTVTLDAAVDTVGSTTYLYRASETALAAGEDDSISRGLEPFGLAGIIGDADGDTPLHDGSAGRQAFGDIQASVEPAWRSFILENGGVLIPFSQDFLQQGMDGVDKLGDGVVDLWVTSHGIRRQYVNQLVSNKRYVGTMELDGGFRAVTYDDRPIVPDKDCTPGRIYGLDQEVIEMYYETDYAWMDADGSILTRLDNHDAYQATLYRYWQLGTWARNRLVGIRDIQDS